MNTEGTNILDWLYAPPMVKELKGFSSAAQRKKIYTLIHKVRGVRVTPAQQAKIRKLNEEETAAVIEALEEEEERNM